MILDPREAEINIEQHTISYELEKTILPKTNNSSALWGTSNRAAKTTWSTLSVLDQQALPFNDAGAVMLNKLAYWGTGESPQTQMTKSKSLAIQIDNIFRSIRGINYENSIDKSSVISEI